MKFTVTTEFDTLDDLLEFYERLRNDVPASYQNTTALIENTNDMIEEAREQKAEEAQPAPVTPTHERGEVKLLCAQASTQHGVNIKSILTEKFGVGSFSALPDSKLDELYDAVKSACGN